MSTAAAPMTTTMRTHPAPSTVQSTFTPRSG